MGLGKIMFFDCFYNTIGCCEGKSDADVEHLAQVKNRMAGGLCATDMKQCVKQA